VSAANDPRELRRIWQHAGSLSESHLPIFRLEAVSIRLVPAAIRNLSLRSR